MSHFTVAVITAEKPTNEVLTKALQPFHEFECTGNKDKYVVGIDKTAEYQADYQKDTIEAVFKNGAFLGTKYDSIFETYWKRKGPYGRSNDDEFVLPEGEGFELRTVNTKDHWTFKEYLEKWMGYSLTGDYNELTPDGKFIVYTNPNKAWDWWVIGGRWSKSLLTKAGEKVDSCMIGDLDFDGYTAKLKAEANKQYDQFEMLAGVVPREWQTWKELRKSNPCQALGDSRDAYHAQPFIVLFNKNNKRLGKESFFSAFVGLDVDDFHCSREEYVERYAVAPFQCHNLLIASEYETEHLGWYGGEMGWFGMSDQAED